MPLHAGHTNTNTLPKCIGVPQTNTSAATGQAVHNAASLKPGALCDCRQDSAFALCVYCLRLPLPCVSTAFVAKTLPLPCVYTAFVANALRFLFVPLPFVAIAPPLPCVSTAIHG